MTIAEGSNFRIELKAGVLTCTVWSRPDLDMAEGARSAEEISKTFIRYAVAPDYVARCAVLDQRDAPPTAGPKTTALLGELLRAWNAAHKRIADIVGDSALRRSQMSRLVREHAGEHGQVFKTLEEGQAWLGLTPAGAQS